MNKYEMTVIFKPTLEEEALKQEFDKVQGYIERFGGTIEKVDDWGKRRLAYEIQKLNDGFYYIFTIAGDPAMPKEIESRLRIMESVLRYLIIRLDA